MSCFQPVMAYPAAPPAKGVVWSASRSYVGAKPLYLPCNQCIGCRMDKARDWSTRISHEVSLHDDSCFLTLTYATEHLPADGSVSKRALQLFFKRYRKEIDPVRIRYFACGEYGTDLGRPHYHALVFGHDFRDKTPWRHSPTGHLLSRSETLERLWPYGHSEIGSVTEASAGYVARYCLKKITGELAPQHYRKAHPATGELFTVIPEFAVMSNRPGIGKGWYDQFASDCFPSDFVVVDGEKRNVPRYYAKLQEAAASDQARPGALLSEREAVKLARSAQRKVKAFARADNNTPSRLAVREEVATRRAQLLVRPLETEE